LSCHTVPVISDLTSILAIDFVPALRQCPRRKYNIARRAPPPVVARRFNAYHSRSLVTYPAMTLLRFVAVLLFAVPLAAHAQQAQLTPVDEGTADASWPRFRTRLLEALARRDEKFVVGILDPRIRNISNKEGPAEFRKLWEPHAQGSPLWVELPKLLFLGSTYVKRDKNLVELCAPYVYFKWPDDAPVGASGAVIARETLVKARPAAASNTMQTLSYHLVGVLDWEVDDEDKASQQKWVKIQTPRGAGFVPEEQIRSPLEYRACFVKRGGAWRMSSLEAGE